MATAATVDMALGRLGECLPDMAATFFYLPKQRFSDARCEHLDNPGKTRHRSPAVTLTYINLPRPDRHPTDRRAAAAHKNCVNPLWMPRARRPTANTFDEAELALRPGPHE
ncbi:MAG: hypothetical protein V3V75_04500 [Thermoguttaceae bacterium]